ncbi:MAG: glycosyltransferase family 4 protein [Flavobacteriales bacterium]|nr:glycosyltransferase family 4 protein [Flavobacteriales bacterium]
MTAEIVFFYRKRRENKNFSIENIFFQVSQYLIGAGSEVRTAVCPFLSNGILPRIRNVLFAQKSRGAVNHITGDVNYLALGLPGKQTVITIHDLIFLEDAEGIKRLILYWFWLKLPLSRCKYITVVSEATKSELIHAVPSISSKIYLIHNPVDPSLPFSPSEFRTDKPVILQIGTGRNKNLDRVIRAITGLRCKLCVIGPIAESIKYEMIRRNIEFENFKDLTREALIAKYVESDLVVFASTKEGFGMPILEAQQIGRPVITSNCSSMPEVAGNGAVLVDPNNVESIRSGILRVIEDHSLREQLIAEGLKNIQRFQLDRVAGQYAELYYNILENNN